MGAVVELKKELHELIEAAADEKKLQRIRKILMQKGSPTQRKLLPKKKPSSDSGTIQYLVLPNGKTIAVTPGDPSVNTDELFGIWKDNPITPEELRKIAWGGRA